MMVNAKGLDDASTSNSSPLNNGGDKSALTETIASSQVKLNVAETVVSENENKMENTVEEVMHEENEILSLRNEENAVEEGINGENMISEKEEEEEYDEEEDEDYAMEEENDDTDAMDEEEEEQQEEGEQKEEEEDKETGGGGGGNAEEEKQKDEKVELKPKENGKKSRKRSRRKKVAQGGSETMAAKGEDKPGSSGKKKVSKKAESMGLVFMCSSKTKKDCYRYKVLGLPASKRDVVQKVYKGMRLFLFDFDLRLMYGIYKAAGPGGSNIEPKAFKSQFPSQVRFTVLNDCLPLAEEKFRKVIKENYYTRNKFNCQLTSEQVKKLCKLFVAASEGPKSEKLTRSLRVETHRSLDHKRIRRPGKERRSTLGGERERRYHERPVRYEREDFASHVAPVSRVRPVRQPALLPSHAYERTLEMDPYRRDPLSEHRDAYRRDTLSEHRDAYRPLSEHRDAYRRDPLSEHRDDYRRDPLSEHRDAYRRDPLSEHHDAYRREPLFEDRVVYRRDPLLEHHDRRHSRHLDDNARRDAYISYRERPTVYSVGLTREHNPPADLPPEYRREHRPSEYRSSAGPLPEYHRFQPLYRY